MYRYVFLPQAIKQLEHEISYSQRIWGQSHATRYWREIIQQIRKIAHQPLLYPVKPEFGDEVRAVRHKGNYIVYRVDENKKCVMIVGVPNIYVSE